jgi:hypothetical protein
MKLFKNQVGALSKIVLTSLLVVGLVACKGGGASGGSGGGSGGGEGSPAQQSSPVDQGVADGYGVDVTAPLLRAQAPVNIRCIENQSQTASVYCLMNVAAADQYCQTLGRRLPTRLELAVLAQQEGALWETSAFSNQAVSNSNAAFVSERTQMQQQGYELMTYTGFQGNRQTEMVDFYYNASGFRSADNNLPLVWTIDTQEQSGRSTNYVFSMANGRFSLAPVGVAGFAVRCVQDQSDVAEE